MRLRCNTHRKLWVLVELLRMYLISQSSAVQEKSKLEHIRFFQRRATCANQVWQERKVQRIVFIGMSRKFTYFVLAGDVHGLIVRV